MFQAVGAAQPEPCFGRRAPAAAGHHPELLQPFDHAQLSVVRDVALVELGPEIRNEAGRHFFEGGQLGLAALDHAVLRVDDSGHPWKSGSRRMSVCSISRRAVVIVALHVGGDREDAAIEAGVAGIPRQGLLEQRPAFLGSPGETLQLPDLAEQLGVVGIERQRLVADLEGLVELVVEEQRRGQGLKRPDILRIEADGGAGGRERPFRRRLLALANPVRISSI